MRNSVRRRSRFVAAWSSILLASAVVPTHAAPAERSAPKLQANGPLLLVISIASQRMVVHGADGVVATTRVSTGQPGHRTPTGVFTVLGKERFHASNIYSGAPMPFMQRITWSGIALHAGVVPNYPASHGCIRMPYEFAPQLFGLTKMGARVVITPTDADVHAIQHVKLPVPVMSAPDLVTSAMPAGGEAIKVASVGSGSVSQLMNPAQRAVAQRAVAVTRQQDAVKRAKAALDTAKTTAEAANDARTDLGLAEDAFQSAQAVVDKAKISRDLARTPEQIERAQATLDKAVADLTTAADELTAMIASEAPLRAEAFAAAAASKSADADVETTAREAALAAKALEPVSVFVSRKEGKVFVRQGWAQMYEAPMSVRDPDQPLGTHTFLAVAANGGSEGLSWLVVSHPEGTAADDTRTPVRRGQTESARLPTRSVTPADALDRIELSAEARAFIADRAWIGASLIISDEGISDETGPYTDFVVLTK